MYDCHNHLQDEQLMPHLQQVLLDCDAIGVQQMVVNGTCEADWPVVTQLAKNHAIVRPALGLHPWKIKDRSKSWLTTLRQQLHNTGASMGEIGLDCWIEGVDIDDQIEVFDAQWRLAVELNRPATLHCLKAWGLLLEKLQTLPLLSRGFLLHSYSGPAAFIQPLTQLGAYFSISGYFAQEKKRKHQVILKNIPIDRLLLETDAPNMLPPQVMNKYPISEYTINHPANINSVYSFAAELFNIPKIELQAQVAQNFNTLFNLDGVH